MTLIQKQLLNSFTINGILILDFSLNSFFAFFKDTKTRLRVNLAIDHELTEINKTIEAINAINTIIKTSKTYKAIKTIKAKKIQ